MFDGVAANGFWTACLSGDGRAAPRRKSAATPVEEALAAQVERCGAIDWADVRASLDGDETAFARIVDRHQARIAEQMWRFSRRAATTEELVQEVFVQAYFGLAKFKGDAPLLHWLRIIAVRVGYKYWKSEARRRRFFAVHSETMLESLPTKHSDPSAAELVDELLARLPPRDRLVLMLLYLEQCSVAETALRTGWSRTMVKVQAFRARGKLRRIWDTYHEK